MVIIIQKMLVLFLILLTCGVLISSKKNVHHERLEHLRRGCLDICNTTMVGVPSTYFPEIRKRVDCPMLIRNSEIDRGRPAGPPPGIPSEMMPYFTYGGKVRIDNTLMLDNHYLGKKAMMPIWRENLVEEWKLQCKNDNLTGNYGLGETMSVYQGLLRMSTVKNGHLLVIGSEIPWLESCALAAGAKKITTLEYGEIISEHPSITSITPDKLRHLYAANQLPQFDAVATFSSVEHSGLGRYGDALNPWGDLQAIARAWCVVKPGGQLLIGVMTAGYNTSDRIEFNLHRVYGPLMFSHLLANWKQIWRADNGSQVVHILEKPKNNDDIQARIKMNGTAIEIEDSINMHTDENEESGTHSYSLLFFYAFFLVLFLLLMKRFSSSFFPRS